MDTITQVERHFNITLQQVSATEWRSLNGCPKCGDSGKGEQSDRFRVFTDTPLVWCRRCGFMAFVDDLDGTGRRPTEQELTNIRLRQIERRQAEQEKRLARLVWKVCMLKCM